MPGLFALYRGMQKDLDEQRLRLQVETMANEVMRLQVLTDDQARELAKLRVELSTLRATQKALLDTSKRLSIQVQQLGGVPIVDVEGLGGMLA